MLSLFRMLLVCLFCLFVSFFVCGTPKGEFQSLPALWTLFHLLCYLVQLLYEGLCLILLHLTMKYLADKLGRPDLFSREMEEQ